MQHLSSALKIVFSCLRVLSKIILERRSSVQSLLSLHYVCARQLFTIVVDVFGASLFSFHEIYKAGKMMNRIQSSLKSPLTMTILSTIKPSAAGYKTVTHCVFDMDGLLLGNYKSFVFDLL